MLRRLLDENTKVHTDEGLTALRDVRVHDMSGQCRWASRVQGSGLSHCLTRAHRDQLKAA